MWLGNINARVVIVGQDPAGSDNVDADNPASYAPGENVGTNVTLKHLLALAAIKPSDVYLTNAILCIKNGAMNTKPRASWATNCRPFLRRTLDLVAPIVAVGLGGTAWRSLCRAYGERALPLSIAIERPPIRTGGGLWLVPMFHPGPLGQASRSLALQCEDWNRLGEWLGRQ